MEYQADTYHIAEGEAHFIVYLAEGDGREPFIHRVPERVVEPWMLCDLKGSTSVRYVPAAA